MNYRLARTKAQNLVSRKMTTAEKLMREISAEFEGRAIVELSTGLQGTISKIEYDYSVWNKQEQKSGQWMVYMSYNAMPPMQNAATPGCWLGVDAVGLV